VFRDAICKVQYVCMPLCFDTNVDFLAESLFCPLFTYASPMKCVCVCVCVCVRARAPECVVTKAAMLVTAPLYCLVTYISRTQCKYLSRYALPRK